MGFFSNLFKKKDADSAPKKTKAGRTEDLIVSYLQEKQASGQKLNAKDYFAQDLVNNVAESKLESALKSILGTSDVEPCGNSTDIDWSESIKYASISMFTPDFDPNGITIILGVDMNDKDVVDIWVGETDAPSISITLDVYPDDVQNANCIYTAAAQKVKDYLASK